MRKHKKWFSLLLCLLLLFPLLPGQAQAITLTAVNDTLLPLSDSTMPVSRNGELYIPSSTFSSFGISSSFTNNALTLFYSGASLTFSMTDSYVYDENLISYSSPAYYVGSAVYVPVKLTCAKFGLSYSTLTVAGESVLRITSGGASGDAAFVSSYTDSITRAFNAYKGIVTPAPQAQPTTPARPAPQNTPVQPPSPTSPIEEAAAAAEAAEPSIRSSRIYLCFYGAPSDQSSLLLDALASVGRTATFFLPADSTSWDADIVRRIVAEGHTPALLLSDYIDETAAALVRDLRAANEQLAFLTGVSTRILSFSDGSGKLTTAQRDAMVDAGFRFWDSTADSGDVTESPATVYDTVIHSITSTSAPVVLRMRHTDSAAQAITQICSYCARYSIPTPRITLTTAPINRIGENS